MQSREVYHEQFFFSFTIGIKFGRVEEIDAILVSCFDYLLNAIDSKSKSGRDKVVCEYLYRISRNRLTKGEP